MKEDIKKTELKKTVKWAKPVKSVKQGLKMYIGPGIRGIVQKNPHRAGSGRNAP